MPPSHTPAASARSHLVFLLNGKETRVNAPDPRSTLIEYLRSEAGPHLTGTKLGCAEGGCGACTVLLTRKEYGTVRHRSVNACMTPLCVVDGCHVTTVEGIGSAEDPHPVQERLAKMHGSQCGFCTPGIVMSLYTTLQEHGEKPAAHHLEESFDGNLCRCTGYRPILDTAKTFASCADIEDVSPAKCAKCPSAALCFGDRVVSDTLSKRVNQEAWTATRPAHAPPSLPDAIANRAADELVIGGPDGVAWYRPASLEQLLRLKCEHPHAKLITGNTEVAIESRIRGLKYPILISAASIPKMLEMMVDGDTGAVRVGASVSLTQLQTLLKTSVELEGSSLLHGSTTFAALARMLKWFASTQIRNTACIGGNLCTASPIGDLAPMLLACGATLTAAKIHTDGCTIVTRTIAMKDWFAGYRKTALAPEEVLMAVSIPPTRKPDTTTAHVANAYKQSRRREDDISIVTAAFTATVTRADNNTSGTPNTPATIVTAAAGLGGVAPTAVLCPDLSDALVGIDLSAIGASSDGVIPDDIVEKIQAAVARGVPLAPNVPGGMPAYRRTLVASMALRFVASCASTALGIAPLPLEKLYMTEAVPDTRGEQRYTVEMNAEEGRTNAHTGQPTAHRSALMQCTGEAAYVDDVPGAHSALHAAAVLSSQATGSFEISNTSAVLAMPGVATIVTAADVKGRNAWGKLMDEQLFREETVTSVGQLLALAVADTAQHARDAAHAVKVTYTKDSKSDAKPIITIAQAIDAKRFHPVQHSIMSGDVDKALREEGVTTASGTVRMNGAEHLYLEPTGAVATPKENSEIEVTGSTQGLKLAQETIAAALGVPMHKVVCKARRLGGGFGGKETRATFVLAAAAVAAGKTKRQVKLILERQDDMVSMGTRHPFRGDYTIAVDRNGNIVAYDVALYSNAGYSTDLSIGVLDRALFHCTNAYRVPNVRAKGYICLTNTVSNTAFRGFGGPQGMLVIESAIEDVARVAGLSPDAIRAANLFVPGDLTPYRMAIPEPLPLHQLWGSLETEADYANRREAVSHFNAANRWKKRGLARLPTVFGISFTVQHLNQGGCTVMAYTDGSVLVSHGGVEMGQGIHTKVIQLVAAALHINIDRVHIAETSTDQVPNSSPTAASASFDIYGHAAEMACAELVGRLAPFVDEAIANLDARFTAAVNKAYLARVDLRAHGWYEGGGVGYDFTKPEGERGTPFVYFTTGVASTEVEIDVLSGDMRVVRADIVMDLGTSPNPAVDIGQVEGAYVQGLGYYTLEETVWGGGDEHQWLSPGACFTRGPGAYKLPSFNDVPLDFRVTLLDKTPNPRAVRSSKAVGEPPLFLAASAIFATRNALEAASASSSSSTALPPLDTPLSPERVRLMAGDALALAFTEDNVRQGGRRQPSLFC